MALPLDELPALRDRIVLPSGAIKEFGKLSGTDLRKALAYALQLAELERRPRVP